jgi:threonine dehydratase
MTGLVSLDAIREAAERVRGFVRRTPMLEVPLPADLRPSRLFLKCENLQVGGAFKVRGAYNLMVQLPDAARRAGVITYSSGNHGVALALAGERLGIPRVVVMPTTAAGVKVDMARRLGAEILFEGTTTIERKARAEAEAARRGLTMVPPFDDPRIIAGQGTAGAEIVEQCPQVSTVYVQMSGGGLVSGIAAAVKGLKRDVRIVGVEPAGAARMTASVKAGQPVTLDKVSGIADGLLAVRPGDTTFRHVQALVDEIVTIDDRAILQALRWLFSEARLVVEPSGAITVAAVLAALPGATKAANGTTVAVLSGGNVEASAYARYLVEAL